MKKRLTFRRAVWGTQSRSVSSCAPDAVGGNHEVVQVALLNPGVGHRGPILFKVHGIDAVVAVGADPIQAGSPSFRLVIDPILEQTVGGFGTIQLHVDFNAKPRTGIGVLNNGVLPPAAPIHRNRGKSL